MNDSERSNKFIVSTLEDLIPVARALIERFGNRTVVLLTGELGVGKTKLVETVAREMSRETASIEAEVASPTFAIHQVYNLGTNRRIDHFDLYRVNSEDELETVGLWDVLTASNGLVFIEWPEKLQPSGRMSNNSKFCVPGWHIIDVRLLQLKSGAREISVSSSC